MAKAGTMEGKLGLGGQGPGRGVGKQEGRAKGRAPFAGSHLPPAGWTVPAEVPDAHEAGEAALISHAHAL